MNASTLVSARQTVQSGKTCTFEWPIQRFDLSNREGESRGLPPVAQLCSSCQSMFQTQLKLQSRLIDEEILYPLQVTLGQMKVNVSGRKCALCLLIFQSLVYAKGAVYSRNPS
jgi:hypothetical protein